MRTFRQRYYDLGRALQILKHEGELLGSYFHSVRKIAAPGGRSKIWICTRGCLDEGEKSGKN